MRHHSLIALGLAFTLGGCQVPLNLIPPAGSGDGIKPAAAPAQVDSTDPHAPRLGTLHFAIRWPEEDLPGFSTQVIPVSTRAVVFTLKDADGQQVVRKVLRRTDGNDIATATLHLPVGMYLATAKAYAVDEPTETDEVIAEATKPNCEVVWGKASPVTLTLGANFAPQITHIGAGHGTPGQTLNIAGNNLDRSQNPIVIFPSGIEKTGTLQGGTITVQIPPGAGSGDLHLRVDGVKTANPATFLEIQSLALDASETATGQMRDGNGDIASWLGDTFSFSVTGHAAGFPAVNDPVMTNWTQTDSNVGNLSSGSYLASKLGTDVVTAHMGSVSGTKRIVVAPPAGEILRPAGDMTGITDHSLTRVGENWLVAWYHPATNRAHWRILDKDGNPLAAQQQTIAATDGSEHALRVAALPDGSSALIAYRAGTLIDGKARNAVVFQALNPLTGAPVGDLTRFNFNGGFDSDRLMDLTASNDQYLLAVLRFDGTKHIHRISSIQVTAAGAEGKLTRTYNPDGVLYYSQTEDSFSMAASGSHFVVARHFGMNGGGGPTGQYLELLNENLAEVRTPKAVVHERNRVLSAATNGNVILTAAMETQASGIVIKVYPHTSNLDQIGLGTKVADLEITSIDPQNWPLKLIWSPESQHFILTYARLVSTMTNGQIVKRPQAMVQAIDTDGTPIGSAYPLAATSQIPTLYPTSEGAMALWLDENRSLIMRRVKYR